MEPAALTYRSLQRLIMALTPLASRGSSKLARGLAGRRAAHARLVAWGGEHRDPGRPGVWIHAPSVGEGLQARAVLEAVLQRVPGLQSLYTHFSPSAEGLARSMPSDASEYLPWDIPAVIRPVLESVAPDLVVFTKTEVWPVLVEESVRLGIPVAMVGAALPPGAGRARPLARAFLRPTWERMAALGAISEADAEGFRSLGVSSAAVQVTGDPDIDSAAQRAHSADPEAPYLAPFHHDPRPTIVAGSTWPTDDAVLLPALDEVRARMAGIRVIVAPHEPGPGHVRDLMGRLAEGGWHAASLKDVEAAGSAGDVDAVVVDRVGVLAHLYTGLHSVLEPAAARLPVVFGPKYQNARAAADLIECEGAREAADAGALADTLSGWLERDEVRDYAAGQAFGYIQRHLGAADRSAALLVGLLEWPRLRK
jgi:3-deoxy-D-manno-octulosonic-acid transferase